MGFITYLEQEQKKHTTMNDKLVELSKILYSKGCAREKRPDGYYSILKSLSNRKARFMVNTDNTNFCYEIVNRDNEQAVIMRENLMSVSNDEIINDIMGYIT